MYEAVRRGEIVIGRDGKIWRIAVRASNGAPRRCKPRRAETTEQSGYLKVTTQVRNSQPRIRAAAHRLVWFHVRGPIPDGLTINHKNGIKGSVLVLKNKLGPKPGEGHHNAKLTNTQVMGIRARLAAGDTQRAIADDHGVSQSTIWAISSGKGWREVAR